MGFKLSIFVYYFYFIFSCFDMLALLLKPLYGHPQLAGCVVCRRMSLSNDRLPVFKVVSVQFPVTPTTIEHPCYHNLGMGQKLFFHIWVNKLPFTSYSAPRVPGFWLIATSGFGAANVPTRVFHLMRWKHCRGTTRLKSGELMDDFPVESGEMMNNSGDISCNVWPPSYKLV